MALLATSMLLHREANCLPNKDTCRIIRSNPPSNIFPQGADPGIECQNSTNCQPIKIVVQYVVIVRKEVVIDCNENGAIPNSRQIYNKKEKRFRIGCKTGFKAVTKTIPEVRRNGSRLEETTFEAVVKCVPKKISKTST